MTDRAAEFPNTVLEIFLEPRPLVIDLRERLDAATAEALRGELGGGFAVVTACNPGGMLVPEAENTRRASHLDERVMALGAVALRADGRSPDGMHRERGWAIGVSREAAMRLAREFGQLALFWFDGGAFWLVGVSDGGMGERLPIGG